MPRPQPPSLVLDRPGPAPKKILTLDSIRSVDLEPVWEVMLVGNEGAGGIQVMDEKNRMRSIWAWTFANRRLLDSLFHEWPVEDSPEIAETTFDISVCKHGYLVSRLDYMRNGKFTSVLVRQYNRKGDAINAFMAITHDTYDGK